MKKLWKGNLLHRMMALLLSAVLTAGTVLGTAPVNVLAQESVSGNAVTEEESGETDGQPDEAAAPQKVMRTAGVAVQADVDVSGDGWVLDVDGKLTIESDAGMVAWAGDANHSTNKKKIKTVELLNGVTKIVWNSFSEASSLVAITIPDSVTEIESFTFVGDALTNITIPAGVTSIGNSAFWNNRALESVTVLGKDPATIDSDIFQGCKFVTDKTKGIKVPAGTAEAYKSAWTDWADYITDGTEDLFDYGKGWTLDNNGKLTIESDEGMIDWRTFKSQNGRNLKVISAEIKEGVTSIPTAEYNGAFSGCSNMTSITIPSSVTNIGERAFYECSKLTDITIPDSVIDIGGFAFFGCSGLTDITIPDSVTSIGAWAFQDCIALTSITLPSGVTEIKYGAFSRCSGLTDIVIPDSVTDIGHWAFRDCSGLQSVTMQGSEPPTLGASSSGTKEHFIGCGFVTNGAKGIKVPAGAVDAYKTAWPDWADYITEGSASEGEIIASGEGWTLDGNGKLTIKSAEGMHDWENYGRNSNAEKVISVEIEMNEESPITSIGSDAFRQCANMESITIPNSVVSIANRAFWPCTSLKEITIPSSVTSIGEGAFNGCSALTSISLPSGVTDIEDSTFSGCSSLTNIMIPSGVTSIGARAFNGCSALTDIVIPDSVTDIGYRAFRDCSGLQSVTMQGSEPPTLGASSSGTKEHFIGCGFMTDNAEGIKVPAGTASAYKIAWPEWADYITDGSASEGEIIASGKGWTLDSNGKLTIESDEGMTDWCSLRISAIEHPHSEIVITVEIQDGVTGIGESAFSVFSNLSAITLPDSMQSIGDDAFTSCYKLTNIEIPAAVTSVGMGAFSECTNLTEVTFAEGIQITEIANTMFQRCTSLTKIKLPHGVTKIGEFAFCGCFKLTNIEIPSGVTDIGRYAFDACWSLTGITIPSSVTKIGYEAFFQCTSLDSVTMQGSTPPTLSTPNVDTDVTSVFSFCKFVTEGTQGIKVPAGTADTYKTAWPEWKDYITDGSAPSAPTDQEKVEAARKAVEDALAGIHMSNATTKESLEADLKAAIKTALEEAGIDSKDVTISVENFTKTEATTDAPGSIKADIKITSGTESATVPVNQTINQLPGTPADKVAAVRTALEDAVKKAIDEALAGTKVTNDNAEEIAAQIAGLIPEAVNEALEAAGVAADEIAIGEVDIAIEPAAADREGSIRVVIPVTSTEDAGQSGNASIQVPVTKPGGEEDPDKEAEEVQKAVEDALKNITITNETTPEDILAALKEALEEEITVEGIEEFEKEDATEDAPGSLRLKIKLILNGNTIYVTVNVSIPQLGRKTGVYVRFTDYYDLAGSTPRYKYTGTAIKPAVEVYNNETLLTPGKDYTISYKNNTKVGAAAALTVKGKGNFTGTSNVVNFAIIHADIDKDTDHPAEMTVVANTKVAPVIMNGAKKLTTKDYKLEGEGLVNSKYAAATAEGAFNTLTVKGIGSYEGSSFEIKVKVIERSAAKKLAVTVDKNFKPVYDGSALNLSSLIKQTQDGEGAITITDSKDKTKILKEGTDFTVICTSSLTNAGTVKFTVTGMGEYTGSVNKTFKISPLKVADNNKFSVTFDEDKVYEYKASGVTVDNLVVKYLGETDSDTDDEVLTQGVDYKVTYSNNKKVSGTKDAGFKITFLGNYKGSGAVSKTFKIAAAKLSADNTVVTVPDKVYGKANKAYKSTPIVTVDGTTIKSSNYTVSYAWATESEAEDDTKYVTDNKVKITIADGDAWAKVKVTVTPKEAGSYGLAEGAVITGEYYVRRADEATNLTKAKVTFFNKAGTQLKTLEYNGNTFYTPAGNNPKADAAPENPNAVYVKVTVSGAEVDPDLYDVIWTNATAKGKATVVIRGKGVSTEKGMAVGSKNQAISIKAMGLKGKNLKSYVEKAVSSLKNIFSLMQ